MLLECGNHSGFVYSLFGFEISELKYVNLPCNEGVSLAGYPGCPRVCEDLLQSCWLLVWPWCCSCLGHGGRKWALLSFLSQSNSHSKVCTIDLCETIVKALNSRLDFDYTFTFYFVTIRSKTWLLFKYLALMETSSLRRTLQVEKVLLNDKQLAKLLLFT